MFILLVRVYVGSWQHELQRVLHNRRLLRLRVPEFLRSVRERVLLGERGWERIVLCLSLRLPHLLQLHPLLNLPARLCVQLQQYVRPLRQLPPGLPPLHHQLDLHRMLEWVLPVLHQLLPLPVRHEGLPVLQFLIGVQLLLLWVLLAAQQHLRDLRSRTSRMLVVPELQCLQVLHDGLLPVGRHVYSVWVCHAWVHQVQ